MKQETFTDIEYNFRKKKTKREEFLEIMDEIIPWGEWVGVIGKVVNVTADERVMVNGKIDMSLVNAIAFDPYTHGYYKVTERVGEAFKDGMKLKK